MRKFLQAMMVGAIALIFASPAWATDDEPCKAGLVCASNPETVAAAIRDAGYKAQLAKDDVGDPKVTSAANGYNFGVYFYDCEKAKACAGLQFQVSFTDDGKNTLEMANDWNRKKRFAQMALQPDKSLRVSYDVTTKGGMTPANFADVVDWWAVMMGELGVYFKETGTE